MNTRDNGEMSPVQALLNKVSEEHRTIDPDIVNIIVKSTLREIRKTYIIAGRNVCCRRFTDFAE